MHVHELHPPQLWAAFAALNAVPRASKREEQVQTHIMNALRALGLEPRRDAVGNIAASKPATPGMENRPKVILQAHLDMVHQKNADTVFDFSTEGIRMRVDGEGPGGRHDPRGRQRRRGGRHPRRARHEGRGASGTRGAVYLR